MRFKQVYLLLIAALGMIVASCSADDYDLPAPDFSPDDIAEGISFTVTPDAGNPNIIHLKSLMPSSYQVMWEHPMGRSKDAEVELHMPFDGSYEVRFAINTRGGYVWSNPVKFTVDEFCADFVSGDLWEFLAGGAGGSKTWVPDNGSYGMKQGFYSCFEPSATHADMVLKEQTAGNWYAVDKTWWEPANGDVGITDGDLIGEMTFSLSGKAAYSVTFNNGLTPATQEGIFNFDPNGFTMSLDGAQLLHAMWADDKSEEWSKNLQVLVLTENQLMIGNYRSEALSGEGKCIYCWNFVSKDYADSYVPPVNETEPTPTLPEGWREKLLNQFAYCTWKLSAESPFDWFTLAGERKNSYDTPEDYPTAYTPIELDPAITLNFATTTPDLYEIETPDDKYSGSYTIDNDGFIHFSNAIGNTAITVGDKLTFTANRDGDDHTLRVLSYETDDLGRISEMWLGYKESDFSGKGVQYVGYHFIANFGGSEGPKAYKLQLCYNNTSNWTMIEGDAQFITAGGTYTLTLNGSNSEGESCLWLDLGNKILKDYPNADIVIKKIVRDGEEIPFDDEAISRSAGDDPTTARRYICNPWGLASCFPDVNVFLFKTKYEVTVDVTFDSGKPFITEEEEEE